jgi:hypothetical protein
MSIWAVIAVVSDVSSGEAPPSAALWLLVPAGMMVFGYLQIMVARWFSKKESQQMSEWLDNLFVDSKIESGAGGEA